MKTVFLTTLVLLGVLSCKSKKGTLKNKKIENSSWEVISLSTKPVTSSQTLVINDEKINGQGGCNKYSGSIQLSEEGKIKLNDILSTKMGCEHLNEEQLFFNNMRASTHYKFLEKDELLLYSNDKVELIKLKKL